MRRSPRFTLLPAILAASALSGTAGGLYSQSAEPMVPPLRRERPLTCRGGPGLVFDTLAADGRSVRLSLTFTASVAAVGLEGQGLEPGTCGWVERPFGEREPRRVHVSIHASDTTPRRSVLDSGVYWGFLAYPTDSGHIGVAGYRHWHASSPPGPHMPPSPAAASAPVAASRRSFPLPFDVRYLPLFAIGMGALMGIPSIALLGRWSGWRRMAERYPDRNTGRGTSFRSGQLVVNRSVYKMGVRFTTDESHLHVAMSLLARPGHRPFSVPWSDITASRDEWPWFPFRGHPMVRLSLAADPGLRFLVKARDGERIAAASSGRLTIDGRGPAAGTARL